MKNTQITEVELQSMVRRSEEQVDQSTLAALAEARTKALESQNRWFSEFRSPLSAGLVTAVLLVAVFLPFSGKGLMDNSQEVGTIDESLELMMEDPEFFLWVSNSYSAISQ